MIKNNISICGIPIDKLKLGSHKRVIKVCDFCGLETKTSYKNVTTSRKRRSGSKDQCFECSTGTRKKVDFKRDLVGHKSGKLTVVKFSHKDSKFHAWWLCICECGTEKTLRGSSLSCFKTKSCGTCAIEQANQKRNNTNLLKRKALGWTKETRRINEIYAKYIRGASTRNLSFELERNDFVLLIKSNCFYCGKTPLNRHRGLPYNGIDRKNNKIGYVIENCVSCCRICNLGKSGLEYKTWIEHIENLTKFRSKL